ncbi:SMI1/KNR4 family protein [Mucilaginibacter sp. PAMB04168]|uniref:SMI1/KNR4 family protein n=1 Tax=Mucilaginibacter sp. PAMB04168 TaxID=3138567 RepID=UPI0031F61018
MSIQEAINQLQAYQGPDKLTLHSGAGENLFMAVEIAYGVTLPDDFKALYRFSDGFEMDEDIFNMIPLAEISSNREGDKDSPFYIAEYMIYSDMWRLEITPDNHNDYKIMVEFNGNQLVLTNSLADFIDRVLKGGVFDAGGLYEWQVEIEALPIYSTKLKTAEPLLTVFYYGLRYNLIPTKEVITWADYIVMHEDEPAPLFIDLSLAHDKKGLLNILYPVTVPENQVITRAILGLLYHRLLVGAITLNDAVVVMGKHNLSSPLTKTEIHHLYYLTDDDWMEESQNDDTELRDKVLTFLANYKEFEISNYKNWNGFNYRIEYQFHKEEKSSITPILKEHPGKSYFNTDLLPNAIIYSLALVSFIVLITTYPLVKNGIPLSSHRSDLFIISRNFFTTFVYCFLLKGGLWLIKRWRP